VIKQVYRKAKKGICLPLSVKELELTELTTDELMHLKEMQSVIATEVSDLPQRMQQIYQLSRVDHLPVAQIAKQLNISEQTVKNTLTTALKRIKQKLSHSHLTDFLL
jgi:RNA polymerase sigma-70 factor (ECF subfamily)